MAAKVNFSATEEKKRVFFPRRGQTLIEALVALTLLSVGFLSIFALLGRSLSSSRGSAESYTATYLAAEGIEVIRNLIDANGIQQLPWNNGFTRQGNYEVEYNSNSLETNLSRFIMYNPTTHVYSYDGAGTTVTPFKRTIKVTPVGANEIVVNSVVSWTGQGGGTFSVNLEDNFLSWRQ